ncbi:MAG: phosphopantetheine-binding protein [Bacillota bacterium]|nr:phosphopantetheine-binding protein [Bacillota bacterium]
MIKGIDERLKKVIAKNIRIGISADEITDESNLIEDFVFDSIQVIKLIGDIETEFDIFVDDEAMVIDKFTRYGALRDYVEGKLAST